MLSRNEREYALQVLAKQREHLELTGFATDRPELAQWRIRAIDRAVEKLKEEPTPEVLPRFTLNPFV